MRGHVGFRVGDTILSSRGHNSLDVIVVFRGGVERTLELDLRGDHLHRPRYSYWFLTGAPRGSVVTISIALGCWDSGTCSTAAGYLQGMVDQPVVNVIEPLKKHIEQFRNSLTPSLLAQLEAEQEVQVKEELLKAQGLPADVDMWSG